MLLLVFRRSGELLRFEFGAPLVPDETPERLARWFLEDPDTRFEELWELTPGDIRSALSALLPELHDDPRRLAAAIRVLGTYGLKDDHELVEPHLAHPDAAVKLAAIGSIGRMGRSPRHDCLLPLLDDPDGEARRAAVLALGKFGIESVAHDLDEAAARHPELARDVTTAKKNIAAIGRRDFVGLLQVVFASREWDDLLSLMLFLKRFLRETVLDTGRGEDERAHAVWALGLWRIRRASWVLQKLLADPAAPPRLRLEALRAIGRARLASTVDTLVGLLGDPQATAPFREEAAIALGRIGRTRAYAPLVARWEDASPGLRAAIRTGLRKLARPPDGPLIEALRGGGGALAPREILRIEDDLELRPGYDAAMVRARLASDDVTARRDAVLLAGCLGTRDDVSALTRLAQGDPDPSLRDLAAWAAERVAGNGASSGA